MPIEKWRSDTEPVVVSAERIEKHVTANEIFTSLGCREETTKAFIALVLEDIVLFDDKQHDRGAENIARHGERGIVLRLWDKLARINRIVWDGIPPKVSEPVEAEFADLSVYGVIARLCLLGQWPGYIPKTPFQFVLETKET